MEHYERKIKLAKYLFDSGYENIKDHINTLSKEYKPLKTAYNIVLKKDQFSFYYDEILHNESLFCKECATQVMKEDISKHPNFFVILEEDYQYDHNIHNRLRSCKECDIIFDFKYLFDCQVIKEWCEKDIDLNIENAWIMKIMFENIVGQPKIPYISPYYTEEMLQKVLYPIELYLEYLANLEALTQKLSKCLS